MNNFISVNDVTDINALVKKHWHIKRILLRIVI